MKENLTGLFLSGLLHAGIISWVVSTNSLPEKEIKPIQNRQLIVSSFLLEKAVKKPVTTKLELPVTSKEEKSKAAVKKSDPKSKPIPEAVSKPILNAQPTLEPRKPITLAKVDTKSIMPDVDKIEPVIQPKPVKAVVKKVLVKKALVKKIIVKKKRVKKVVVKQKVVKKVKAKRKPKKKLTLKPSVKKKTLVKRKSRSRSRSKSKPKRKIAKKRVIKRTVVKQARKPRIKPIARRKIVKPKINPKKKLAVKTHQQARRTTPSPRRIIRKAPPAKKYVKRGGAGINNRKSANARKTVRRQVVRTRQTARKPARQHHKPASTQKKPAVNSAVVSNLSKQYKARLHQLIVNVTKKNYPKRAKRRHQQGRVSVSFTVSHSGTITNIKVFKSSSTAALDKAAIKAIQKVSRKLRFLKGMPKKSLNLKITVAYVLK